MAERSERLRRGHLLVSTLTVLIGAVAVGTAFTQTPLHSDYATILDPARGPGLPHLLTIEVRPDLDRWTAEDRDGELFFVPVSTPGESLDRRRPVVAGFPEGVEHRYAIRTASTALRLDVVARRAPGLAPMVREHLGPDAPEPVVLEIGTRGTLFSPLWPVCFVALSLFMAIKGSLCFKELESVDPMDRQHGEFFQLLLYGLLAFGGGVGLLLEQCARRVDLGAVWTAPAFVGIGAMIAVRAARHLADWIDDGAR